MSRCFLSKESAVDWNKLKERLKKEGSESVTNCHQLKMQAADVGGMVEVHKSTRDKSASGGLKLGPV